MEPNEEIGPELLASQLREKTVVVTRRDDRDIHATLWVRLVTTTEVVFFSGVANTHFLAMRSVADRDKLIDDTGKQVHIYEYLGAV